MEDQQVDENLDLLDLEENSEVDTLPEETPFSTPRPKRPWLLLGVGLAVIVLATYIIVKTVGGDSESVVKIDLDSPVESDADIKQELPSVKDLDVPAKPVEVEQKQEKVEQQEQKKSVEETNGTPIRVITDRKDVVFDPNKTTSSPKVTAKTTKQSSSVTTKKTQVATTSGGWYVQFGSYTSRSSAETAERQIRKGHENLFSGKQFVILAAVLPNGQTTYRLRIAFQTPSDANGFCRNAKSDGLDCYVSK